MISWNCRLNQSIPVVIDSDRRLLAVIFGWACSCTLPELIHWACIFIKCVILLFPHLNVVLIETPLAVSRLDVSRDLGIVVFIYELFLHMMFLVFVLFVVDYLRILTVIGFAHWCLIVTLLDKFVDKWGVLRLLNDLFKVPFGSLMLVIIHLLLEMIEALDLGVPG